ncbi:hypothetical protein CFC21_044979 [Triticum aestivum]|uniref:NAC domain-containing protein n=2 Tax=Triticum aestivum TaxID=4565 RepID=A0A3B6FZ08_WHEAT|nr:hypothetical protein CFC21_044979 [Triticum aestivum]
MNHAPPGFRFTPTREELIGYYLNPWVADPGKTPVAELRGIVCVADIYGEDPAALTSRHRRFGHDDGNWYFLCVARWKGAVGGRASRAVRGGGTWHGYGKRVAVAEAGHRQAFEYLDARGRKTAWLMEEIGTVLPVATGANGVRVLCRSSKASRSSKRRRRQELKPLGMVAMEKKPEPLEHVFAKDEPESWEILAMEDEAEPWEMITMEDELEQWETKTYCEKPSPLQMLTNNLTWPQEILTNKLPWPLEMLTNNLPWPLEMLTNNLTLPSEMLSKNFPLPLEMLTNNLVSPLQTLNKNLPEPAETATKNLPSPLEILTKNLPKPLEILTKEEPTTTTTAFDQDSGTANKEATPNAEMEMQADAEWHSHYPELFEQKEAPPMEDVMKPLPAPTVQEFEQGAALPAAAVEEFGGVAWSWGGHGRRCLVRPISLAWILPGFSHGYLF